MLKLQYFSDFLVKFHIIDIGGFHTVNVIGDCGFRRRYTHLGIFLFEFHHAFNVSVVRDCPLYYAFILQAAENGGLVSAYMCTFHQKWFGD